MKRKASAAGVTKQPKKKSVKTGDYQKGRELTRTPKSELKAFDIARTATNVQLVATPPAFNLLNQMINGAELYQRVGRKVYMKSLHVRGYFQNIATTVQDAIRIIVFYDSQANAAAPTIANLLQDSNAAAGTTAESEINLFNRARFKILRDKQFCTPAVTNTAGVLTNLNYPSNNVFEFNEFIKLKGLEAVYNGTNGGTIADITSGSLYLVTLCDQQAAGWQFIYTSRLRYYD